jgi:TetR/AcrR family transcriptional regulator
MADKTEQKILDAALKVFSEKGYTGATTRVIAQESGFSELTLFRKFKTKENLFNMVLLQNSEKIKKDFGLAFGNTEFENPRNSVSGPRNEACESSIRCIENQRFSKVSYGPGDFLNDLIRNIARIQWDNFDLIHLLDNEQCRKSNSLKEELVDYLEGYIQKNIDNDKIDCKALGITIFSLTYTLNLSRYNGDTFMNQGDVLEGFINNTIMCI